ncbi:hypothetical protein CMO91_03150 [Candidatus Woesearchaeota archaeon]|nr:hypothetical protein [Candidatus Woesearchaeota archaeon]|tara:strand:+ start:1379 stop:2167 length:789 start_codon:yes stop_codon:yes gene_type:complete
MRWFILSDIHANLPALNAVVDHMIANGLTKDNPMAFLGDIVGYGPFVNECCDWVFDNCRVILPGNHDHGAVLSWREKEGQDVPIGYPSNPQAARAMDFAADNLTDANVQRLSTLIEGNYVLGSGKAVFAHCDPAKPQKMRYVEKSADASYRFIRTTIPQDHAFVGHTHIPQLYRKKKDSTIEVCMLMGESVEFSVKDYRSLIVVPSVGQPRDGNPQTGYVTYDTNSRVITVHRLDYAVEEQQAEMLKQSFPPSLITRLRDGR